MKITIVFDLDGTLLNTLEDLTNSVNYALKKCGYPLRTREEVRLFVGNGVQNLMRRAVPEHISPEDFETCLSINRSYYQSHCQIKTKPYDGILELLSILKRSDIQTAVVSNKFDSAVKALCPIYFGDRIDLAIGNIPERAIKPAPDAVYAAMHALCADKQHTLYVGDSDVDIDTAKNVGIPSCGVTWGFRDRDLLLQHGADYIIDHPSQLLSVLSKQYNLEW